MLLPVGGIIGGVGGGALADFLSKRGGRVWITGGASILAVPFITESLLAGSYQVRDGVPSFDGENVLVTVRDFSTSKRGRERDGEREREGISI